MLELENFVTNLPLVCEKPMGATNMLPCIAKLERSLYDAARIMGFEYVRFTCWHKEVADHGEFPLSFSINFSNFPKAWEMLYEAKRYYLHDPVVRVIEEADQNKVVFGTWQQAWREVAARETAFYLERMQALSKDAEQHDIQGGFYMMLVMGLNRFVISLGTSRNPETVEAQAAKILPQQVFSLVALLSQAMNLTHGCNSCGKSFRIQGGESIQLTKKQNQILTVFAEHASASNVDVARINHVTVETVAFHLKAIRKKFNQPNASGHALSNIAMMHGLI
ncbi:MAG TPA: autoinducer binding domain-containing protein [Pseudomonadales bacterium]|jgi:DNA-binding CsgD family transcriptional regulator|nr:autoinducer binding domain-containing protein [Cellvibrionales bacterium]HRF86998.1 autoinducer binding domain-containing protein [Pseudomonadales bacterium]HRG49840.1 autoinducer binding domain-containing protein [Pseudomonadales bacterium]